MTAAKGSYEGEKENRNKAVTSWVVFLGVGNYVSGSQHPVRASECFLLGVRVMMERGCERTTRPGQV